MRQVVATFFKWLNAASNTAVGTVQLFTAIALADFGIIGADGVLVAVATAGFLLTRGWDANEAHASPGVAGVKGTSRSPCRIARGPYLSANHHEDEPFRGLFGFSE